MAEQLFKIGSYAFTFILAWVKKKGAASIDALPTKPIQQSSRLNQTEVAILSLVKDAEPVRIRVAKDNELIRAAGQFEGSFFSSHRLHGVSTRRDDPNRRRRRLQLAVRIWRHY